MQWLREYGRKKWLREPARNGYGNTQAGQRTRGPFRREACWRTIETRADDSGTGALQRLFTLEKGE
eukprot:8591080-Prorocentrum_lima.AAC.1